MQKLKQKTLKNPVHLSGVGLHSGHNVAIEVLPAAPNTGIIFLRTDSDNSVPVAAHVMNVSATELCTTIGAGASSVATIEHLMAAFAGLGIDNAFVKVNGPEIPILDGSSVEFVNAFNRAGIVSQAVARRYYRLKKSIEVKVGDRYIKASPANRMRMHCTIDFATPAIGRQSSDIALSQSNFMKLCNARTFCHVGEVVALRKAGLAQGGSLDNAIVVDDNGILNQEGLRTKNEFAKHKLLDTIGDLALLGAPLIGEITLHKPGHSLHVEFMNELLRKRHEYLELMGDEHETSRAASADSEDFPLVAAAMVLP